MFQRLVLLAGIIAVFAAVGCGPSYSPVAVKVTLDGVAVEGATVSLVSKDTKIPPASGQTDATGVAKIKSSNDRDGVMHGEYSVLVSKTEGPKGMDPSLSPTENMAKFAKGGKGGAPGQGAIGGKSKDLLPAKYGDASKALFTITVPTSGTFNADLTSK